jgi:hypothetical protein
MTINPLHTRFVSPQRRSKMSGQTEKGVPGPLRAATIMNSTTSRNRGSAHRPEELQVHEKKNYGLAGYDAVLRSFFAVNTSARDESDRTLVSRRIAAISLTVS